MANISPCIRALESQERHLIVSAYKEDYSIAEISRCLGFSNFERVYAVIRSERLVGLLSNRYSIEIHPKLAASFKLARHSFPKWANSHGFEIYSAATALKSLPNDDDVFTYKVHAALKRDFCNLYSELFHGTSAVIRYANKYDETKRSKYGLIMEWDQISSEYRAFIPEHQEIEARGDSWDSALLGLKQIFNIKRRILKLEMLISYGLDWKEVVGG
jgi:hypothetical protein